MAGPLGAIGVVSFLGGVAVALQGLAMQNGGARRDRRYKTGFKNNQPPDPAIMLRGQKMIAIGVVVALCGYAACKGAASDEGGRSAINSTARDTGRRTALPAESSIEQSRPAVASPAPAAPVIEPPEAPKRRPKNVRRNAATPKPRSHGDEIFEHY